MLKNNLVILRNMKAISQEEIAGIIGISRQAYARWEKGETVPDIEKCDKLAEFYGITIDDLLHFETHQHGMTIPPGPKGKHICGVTTLGEKGHITIPKEALELLHMKEQDSLVVLVDEEEGLALVNVKDFKEKLDILQTIIQEQDS